MNEWDELHLKSGEREMERRECFPMGLSASWMRDIQFGWIGNASGVSLGLRQQLFRHRVAGKRLGWLA